MTEATNQPMTKTTLHLPASLVFAAKERALKESRSGGRVTLRDIAEKALAAYLKTPFPKSARKD
jgi:hypothetical protein